MASLGRFGVRRLAVIGSAVALGSSVASVGLLSAAAPVGATPSCTGTTIVTCTFSYTGGAQTFVVPVGVSTVTVDSSGAQGGPMQQTGAGKGGEAIATISVTPGETLTVDAGGSGNATVNSGFNGGGNGPSGASKGGGASDVKRGTTILVIAGGGGGRAGFGGAPTAAAGGPGGAADGNGGNGGSVSSGPTSCPGGLGGHGGPEGGAFGGGSPPVSGCGAEGSAGTSGTSGQGGTGGATGGTGLENGGGGGGGGSVGGGGGGGGDASDSGGGGGGGGSSAVPDSTATGKSFNDGVRAGDGQVIIAYTPPAPTPPVNTERPAISGIDQQGQTLSTTNGTWTNNPTTFTYQWSQCDASGNTCIPKVGANSSTYTLLPFDVTDTIRVAVTAFNAFGSTTATSDPTAVIQGPAATTATTLTSSANPSVVGQPVTFTATVTPDSGTTTPTGTVTFTDTTANTTLSSDVALTAGTASCTPGSPLAVGNHAITTSYTPADASFTQSSGSLNGGQQVNQAATTTAVSSSANPSTVGQPVSFTATVTVNSPGQGTPTGTVQFMVDGVDLGGPVTLSGGAATSPAASSMKAGSHDVVTNYSGSTDFLDGAGSLSQIVTTRSCATLAGCNLHGLNLSGADLSGANLSNANLSKANLSGANLSNANLSGANLNGANLTGAKLNGATTTGANLNKVTWRNTTCPDGTNSNSDGGICAGHL